MAAVAKQPEATTPTAPLHNKHLDATLTSEGKPRSMEGKRHKGGSVHQMAAPANSGGAALQPVTSSEMTRAIVLASYSHPPNWYPTKQSMKEELVSYEALELLLIVKFNRHYSSLQHRSVVVGHRTLYMNRGLFLHDLYFYLVFIFAVFIFALAKILNLILPIIILQCKFYGNTTKRENKN